MSHSDWSQACPTLGPGKNTSGGCGHGMLSVHVCTMLNMCMRVKSESASRSVVSNSLRPPN